MYKQRHFKFFLSNLYTVSCLFLLHYLTSSVKWKGVVRGNYSILKFSYNKCKSWGFHGGSVVKNLPANAGDMGLHHGSEDPLVKEMEAHFSIFAWEIPWTEEPGGLVHGVEESWAWLRD